MKSAYVLAVLCLTGAGPGEVHVGKPPAEAWALGAPDYLSVSPSLRAGITPDIHEKSVGIHWMYGAHAMTGAPLASSVQDVEVNYWPTAIAPVAADKLLVAGKRRDGATIIELWTLSLRQPSVDVSPAGEIRLSVGSVSNVTPLFEQSAVEFDMVKFMVRQRGKPSSVLIQFIGSRHVYELDWFAMPPVTPTLVLSTEQQPALSNPGYDAVHAGEHANHGYVYVFGDDQDFGSEAIPLVLFDSDNDGTIDSSKRFTHEQFAAAGLKDPTQYTEYKGLPNGDGGQPGCDSLDVPD